MQDAKVAEVSEAMVTAMTKLNGWQSMPLPKRNGPRGMLPSTWLGRSVRLGYLGVDGEPVESSATLLDWCGCGPVFNKGGVRTLVSWDRIVTVELVPS